jgi:hypothetical protein
VSAADRPLSLRDADLVSILAIEAIARAARAGRLSGDAAGQQVTAVDARDLATARAGAQEAARLLYRAIADLTGPGIPACGAAPVTDVEDLVARIGRVTAADIDRAAPGRVGLVEGEAARRAMSVASRAAHHAALAGSDLLDPGGLLRRAGQWSMAAGAAADRAAARCGRPGAQEWLSAAAAGAGYALAVRERVGTGGYRAVHERVLMCRIEQVLGLSGPVEGLAR